MTSQLPSWKNGYTISNIDNFFKTRMEKRSIWKKEHQYPSKVPEDESSEKTLVDYFQNCSDDNFEMKVVPENKKQLMSSKVCALQDKTKSYVR